ncbi:MAG: hypothetical protein QOC95_2379 [Thermoleophilaceae bacterium]|jgi:hypothetical protein|nr:hypothetical protein [Thermoleophilaceae bacterium]
MHRFRNPALLGNLLLVVFALLLVLAVLNRADAVSDLPHHHRAHTAVRASPQ